MIIRPPCQEFSMKLNNVCRRVDVAFRIFRAEVTGIRQSSRGRGVLAQVERLALPMTSLFLNSFRLVLIYLPFSNAAVCLSTVFSVFLAALLITTKIFSHYFTDCCRFTVCVDLQLIAVINVCFRSKVFVSVY